MIEVRGFKWPRRPTAIARAHFLGEDAFGRWLGIAEGSPWWEADGSASGVFVASFVQVVPDNAFWTANFSLTDPVVDVDVVLPVRWIGEVVEEVDLELDVLRFADGRVEARDRETFDRVRAEWTMPDDIVAPALETCALLRKQVAQGFEPFGSVGRTWLARFLEVHQDHPLDSEEHRAS